MAKHLRPAIVLLLLFTLLTGLAYPLALTGIAQILMPYQANGSLIFDNGRVMGSELSGRTSPSRAISTAAPRPRAATATTPPLPPARTSAPRARR